MRPKANHQKQNLKELTKEKEDNESSILDLNSLIADEEIGIRDIPIFRTNKVGSGTAEPKPIRSAYILIDMSATEAPELRVNARVCVDTGADMTICSHTFVIKKVWRTSITNFSKNNQ